MRDSARAKTELAAAGGSAGAVAVDSRVEPQRTAIDSVAAKARASAANAGASADARRQFQRSVQLNEVVTTGSIEPAPGGSDIVGCYQIKAEPNTVALLLPGRFALERSSGAAAPNVVRAVTPEWRKDSVVRGSNWIQLADNKAEIQSIDGRKRQVVSLSLTSLVAGQATMPGISQPVAVLRAPCRP
ncbi:MAG: hypothetical protein ABJF01_05080 [bacterium]